MKQKARFFVTYRLDFPRLETWWAEVGQFCNFCCCFLQLFLETNFVKDLCKPFCRVFSSVCGNMHLESLIS